VAPLSLVVCGAPLWGALPDAPATLRTTKATIQGYDFMALLDWQFYLKNALDVGRGTAPPG
jgi:hypothetical protein